MKKLLLLVFVVVEIFALSGREVMEKQKKLQSSNNESDTELMLLIDSDGHKEKRVVKRYIKKNIKTDLSKNLLIFIQPADIRGVSLLNKERSKDKEDQWLYLPAIHKLQRIAEGNKKNYFMGTDFTYEDLSRDRLDNYKFKIIKIDNFGKDKCYVIEAIPVKSYLPKTSYGKKILWINKDKFYTERIEFYNKDGKLIKIQNAYKFRHIKGTIYRPMFIEMNNIAENHKTLVKIINLKVNSNLNDKYFNFKYLLTEQYLQ